MRSSFVHRAALTALAIAVAACSHATGPADTRQEATLVLTTTPDFSATVTKAWYESANGPAGPYAQYDVWVAIAPATSANAGVVVPVKAPVFLRSGGRLLTASGEDIRAGDRIQVWRDPVFVGYGAVQGPPGAPTYEGRQIVIVR